MALAPTTTAALADAILYMATFARERADSPRYTRRRCAIDFFSLAYLRFMSRRWRADAAAEQSRAA